MLLLSLQKDEDANTALQTMLVFLKWDVGASFVRPEMVAPVLQCVRLHGGSVCGTAGEVGDASATAVSVLTQLLIAGHNESLPNLVSSIGMELGSLFKVRLAQHWHGSCTAHVPRAGPAGLRLMLRCRCCVVGCCAGQVIASWSDDTREMCSPFVSAVTHLADVFVSRHSRALETSTTIPITAFLGALFTFTTVQVRWRHNSIVVRASSASVQRAPLLSFILCRCLCRCLCLCLSVPVVAPVRVVVHESLSSDWRGGVFGLRTCVGKPGVKCDRQRGKFFARACQGRHNHVRPGPRHPPQVPVGPHSVPHKL